MIEPAGTFNPNGIIGPKCVSKVVVIGAGLVGATYAYALIIQGLAPEIVLIDVDRKRAEGEAADLNHGLAFVRPATIRAGDYPDCEGADVIVIAAGAPQKPGETRLDLVRKNTAIMRDIMPKVLQYNQTAIIVVVANPVDVLTYAALKISGLPPSRVIGSGTLLDSSRFRYLLGRHCGVDPRNVHAYIIGEHGDSEVPVWSRAHIAGMRLDDEYCPACGKGCGHEVKDAIFEEVRTAAYYIIERKRATYYGIGLALAAITSAILRGEKAVMTLSCLVDDYYGVSDICLSVPVILGRNGIQRILKIKLSDSEAEAFRRSGALLKEAADSVGL